MQVSRRISARRSLLLTALFLLAAGLLALAFRPQTIRGVVTDANGPVAGATVRLRASLASTTTGADGRFALSFRGPALHRAVTAWKEGYYPAAADLSVVDLRGFRNLEGLTLLLKPHPTVDDPTYQWLTSHPDPNQALGCGHCMTNYDEWKLDAHALSATNPRFLSVYNGTDLTGQAVAEPGFRLDLPQNPGNCANCHAPAAALAHNGAADMNRLTGVETEGIPCDLCHKIGDVTLDPVTGLPHAVAPGVQSFRLYRPAAGTQVFFGTLDDIPRRVSAPELERQSQFCAPCHSGSWWGVSAYASYDEWLASPYATEGVTCQACHMPAEIKQDRIVPVCPPASAGSTSAAAVAGRFQPASDTGASALKRTETNMASAPQPAEADFHLPETAVSTAEGLREAFCRIQACVDCHLKPADPAARNPLAATTLIPDRPPETLHNHRMTGVTDEAFMRSSVAMTVTATQGSDGVLVDIAITNVGAGHHIPTDSPMRNLILVVTAHDAQGNALPYLGDQSVPAWGGEGPIEAGNYAGLPGKGFAKVLEDYNGNAPAPQWRNGIHILSDNRIPARATDVSHYAFALPSPVVGGRGGEGGITISARLIFRRAFKPWADAKGWNEPDLIMAQTTVKAARSDQPVLPGQPQPSASRPFAPSPATTATGERLASTDFAAPEQCIACHSDIAAGWQASGHAVATTAPLYRAWFKAADQDTQGAIGPYCAGCHTPIGLLSGQIRSRWAWSGRELYPLDDRARTGVSCDVCHSITEMTGIGDGAYVMDERRKTEDEFVVRHSSFVSRQHDLIRTPEFCASCHEATNPTTGLPVMTTYSEWQRSHFNTGDPVTTTTCQGCHFADGRHGKLRPEDLKAAARIEILPPLEKTPGKELELKVRVSNVGAGHDLPTGAAELRKAWLAVSVTDAEGRVIFTSGATDPYGDPVEGSATYGVTWQDAAGHPTDRLWEAQKLFRDHRIPAGGTVTETYRFALPAGAQRPLRIRAALNYRASTGYLNSLMTIYLGEDVPSAPVIEMAAAETLSK
jgi:nitrate/TMAO reductase-like tetraheme cytochrome c subunit